ncbi:MAG: DUF6527 family protein [Agathobacter sp.]
MQVVHRVPEKLKSGLLYICFDCNVVAHLCACGCGEKVILPIDPNFWSVKYDGETVSLAPSIGNFQFPCKSHYWIKENRVIWADTFTPRPEQSKKRRRRKKKRFMDKLKAFF